MVSRPSHILPADLDARDADFAARCMAWRREIRGEMDDLVAHTKQTITESRDLLDNTDRLLARSRELGLFQF